MPFIKSYQLSFSFSNLSQNLFLPVGFLLGSRYIILYYIFSLINSRTSLIWNSARVPPSLTRFVYFYYNQVNEICSKLLSYVTYLLRLGENLLLTKAIYNTFNETFNLWMAHDDFSTRNFFFRVDRSLVLLFYVRKNEWNRFNGWIFHAIIFDVKPISVRWNRVAFMKALKVWFIDGAGSGQN